MPQLLLELLSEEIPARMQGQAGRDLARLLGEGLKGQGLQFETLKTFAGPRRLTAVVEGLPAAQADRIEERKGPRANAPEAAVAGFLRSTGLAREALSERDGVLYAQIARPGRPTPRIAAEVVGALVAAFPWPKSMRSGSSAFRWVRPLKSVLFLFDGAVVPFDVAGLVAGRSTRGHRFIGAEPGVPFEVGGFSQYREELARRAVTLDAADRRALILERAAALCAAEGLELVPDEALADEVAGLVEHPVPLLGAMDPAFLDLPAEVIRTSMRTHQKYFAVRDPKTGRLAPRFVVVANIEARDGGAEIARGNAKVLSARLSDARFFWEEDQKPGAIDGWLEKLKGVTFHAKLGSMAERVERIAALAAEIAPAVGADPKLAGIAARLAKADLASAMVGEFPELQGVMGGYYVRRAPYASPFPVDGGRAGVGGARADGDVGTRETSPAPNPHRPASTSTSDPSPIEGEGRVAELLRVAEADGEEDPLATLDQLVDAPRGGWWDGLSREEVDQVADAVRDHYKPLGPGDSVPTAPVTVAVALADKLDTLVGFFAIDERPTGSRDPYALRRAALGVIRLLTTARCRLSMLGRYYDAEERYLSITIEREGSRERAREMLDGETILIRPPWWPRSWRPIRTGHSLLGGAMLLPERAVYVSYWLNAQDLLAFFADRLKVQLREEGRRHDLVDAVFALGDDDLVRIVDRVEALSGFLATEDGANLLAGYRRAANILKAEEKKGETFSPLPLDGGGAGGGGARAGVDEGTQEAPPASSDLPPATTPIPGPSPIEGEGSGAAERDLQGALQHVQIELEPKLEREDFRGAMTILSHLRAPVDAFFEQVLVNDPDPAVREHRLRLLATLRAQANRVADFSLIQG